MELSVWQTAILSLLIAAALLLPLTVHKIEKNLEIFVHPVLVLLFLSFYFYLEFRKLFQNIYHEEI